MQDTASGLDWDDIQLFLSLARTRRLSVTAKALGFDTSTASRRLARLEGQLQVSLFDRTREGLVPTASTRKLLIAASDMERAAHAFRRELSGFEREVEGLVKLSVPPGVAEGFVAPLLEGLGRLHPLLTFEVDASTRQADLTRREADLAIRTIRPSGGPLVRQLLTRARWVPMATPEVVAQLGRLQRWDEVPWVAFGAELQDLHVSKWLTQHVHRAPFLRSNSFAMQIATVRQGLGAMLVPEPYASVYRLEPLRVSRRLAVEARKLAVDELWLVTHEALRRVPRVAAVWDFLAARFR